MVSGEGRALQFRILWLPPRKTKTIPFWRYAVPSHNNEYPDRFKEVLRTSKSSGAVGLNPGEVLLYSFPNSHFESPAAKLKNEGRRTSRLVSHICVSQFRYTFTRNFHRSFFAESSPSSSSTFIIYPGLLKRRVEEGEKLEKEEWKAFLLPHFLAMTFLPPTHKNTWVWYSSKLFCCAEKEIPWSKHRVGAGGGGDREKASGVEVDNDWGPKDSLFIWNFYFGTILSRWRCDGGGDCFLKGASVKKWNLG